MAYRNVQELHAAILANDGATVSLDLQEEPTSGYMVSLAGSERQFDRSLFARDGVLYLLQFMVENFDDLNDLDLAYIGAWVDVTGGQTDAEHTVYLDVSVNVDDLQVALLCAKHHGQLAIWDVENAQEIRL